VRLSKEKEGRKKGRKLCVQLPTPHKKEISYEKIPFPS
jgi:hypothetical protein